MRLLLDTHTFLWWTDDPSRLSPTALDALTDPANAMWLSLASCWEIAIKQSLGKLRLTKPLARLVAEEVASNGLQLLGVELPHVVRVADLPFHHRDPFDRLLVAQAQVAGLCLVTSDEDVRAYGGEVLW